MTQEEAQRLIDKRIELEWDEPLESSGRGSAIALIVGIDDCWLVSDEGLGFRFSAMRCVKEFAD